MKIGILGSGNVGQVLAKGFLAEGHEVFLATRDTGSEKADMLRTNIEGAYVCSFADAAKQCELAVLCTPWVTAADALKSADAVVNLHGKVLIDANNVVDRSGEVPVYGMPEGSAAQEIQRWLPETKVVKAFNTVGANMMYKPQLSATPTMFIAGDDEDAKKQVSDIITSFGWEPLDNGPLVASRELEAMVVIWLRNAAINGRDHAFKML
ncbi:MAG: NAD(P)-binding domain-containing protein [Candidatus Saccharibacteria bacterium]